MSTVHLKPVFRGISKQWYHSQDQAYRAFAFGMRDPFPRVFHLDRYLPADMAVELLDGEPGLRKLTSACLGTDERMRDAMPWLFQYLINKHTGG